MENAPPASSNPHTVEGIVSGNPGPVIHLALPVFFAILFILLMITWFVRYPEIIKATTVLVNQQDSGLIDIKLGLSRPEMKKISPGQKIRLQIASQLQQKMDYVPAIIQQVLDSSTGYEITLRIQLPNGMVTNRGQAITYQPGLQAETIIFVNDLRLLQRILKQNPYLFN